jgi:hypothetical protein
VGKGRVHWGRWRYAAGCLVSLLFGWFAFVRGTGVPLLGLVDLGFHELGHLLTYLFPDVVTAIMGSVVQAAVPLGLALLFAGFAVCLWHLVLEEKPLAIETRVEAAASPADRARR